MSRGGVALLLLLVSIAAATWPSQLRRKRDDENSRVYELIRWAQKRGAQLKGFSVGRACPTCERGVIASTNLAPGDVILKLPFKAALRLKEIPNASFPAEFARDLLDWLHNKPDFNDTWSLFWSIIDVGPDSTFTPELYRDEHLELLQSPELAELVELHREMTVRIYDGSYPEAQYEPFEKTVPADRVSLDTFKVVTSLIGSRGFSFAQSGAGSAPYLLPLADLINHSDTPNAERSDDGDNVLLTAVAFIWKGEEIVMNYQPYTIHRPDMSLYIYGFVIPKERPFLASIDLPTFDPAAPFKPTAPDDSDHYPGGKFATEEEFYRLSMRLAYCRTTEEEDQALLDGGNVTDWRVRSILQFRIMRKRALRQTLERLGEALGLHKDDQEEGQEGGDDWAVIATAAAEASNEIDGEEGEEGETEEVEVEAVDGGEAKEEL